LHLDPPNIKNAVAHIWAPAAFIREAKAETLARRNFTPKNDLHSKREPDMAEAVHSRILGLDVGDARIGVAISDPTQLIASPLTIIERSKGQPLLRIIELAHENSAATLVVGLPRNMDGTLGPQARKVQDFATRISQSAPEIEIAMVDERFSTMESRQILIRSGASKKKRRQHVDAISASVILQTYLDMIRHRGR
jgi:putative Holliday junction resolvase